MLELFVKQMFLQKKKSKNASEGHKADYEYSYGLRARAQFGQMSILKYVSKEIYLEEEPDAEMVKELEATDKNSESEEEASPSAKAAPKTRAKSGAKRAAKKKDDIEDDDEEEPSQKSKKRESSSKK